MEEVRTSPRCIRLKVSGCEAGPVLICIDSVVEATVAYYAEVVQDLQAFVPKAPPIAAPKSSQSGDKSAIASDDACK